MGFSVSKLSVTNPCPWETDAFDVFDAFERCHAHEWKRMDGDCPFEADGRNSSLCFSCWHEGVGALMFVSWSFAILRKAGTVGVSYDIRRI